MFGIALFCTVSAVCQTYIKNVTIIDVEKQKLIPEQTVIINGNVITGIQSSKDSKIPSQCCNNRRQRKVLNAGAYSMLMCIFSKAADCTPGPMLLTCENMCPMKKKSNGDIIIEGFIKTLHSVRHYHCH